MKTLSISEVRNHLPAVLNEVAQTNEPVVVARHGKPVASIVPYAAGRPAKTRHPLRGRPLTVAADFDEPMPDLWQALSVAEERPRYVAKPSNKSAGPRRRRTGKRKDRPGPGG